MSEVGGPSAVGRLLEEISWEKATRYRDGGRGFENVLTTEVLGALDFLPREAFLGEVLQAAHGADEARAAVVRELEDAVVSILPGDMSLTGDPISSGQPTVQPDALITSPNALVLVEAKRLRSASFAPQQLAREYLALETRAADRIPLLLLLGVEPPILVKGFGRMSIQAAVARELSGVMQQAGAADLDEGRLLNRVDQVFCWISWAEVDAAVATASAAFRSDQPSVLSSVHRLAGSITRSIAWHA